jgi:lipopolysaccharide export LptBFGC system permease protein LptF
MKKLDKLILGSFIGPFVLTFLVVDFVLLTVNMLKYFDEIFGKGLGFAIYMELIGYFVISISPMALPLAVLLSSLMTFGNLGEHFELTAIKSSGISLVRALRPIGVFVVILAFAAYLSNNYLVPKVNLKTFSLLYDIRMKSPALDIKEGVFYSGIPGYSLKVNKKLDEIRLNEIIIYNHSDGQGNLNVTMADSGRMEPFLNDNYMKMTLYQGQNYREARATRGISEKPVEFSRTEFTENIIIFDLDAFQLSRTPEDQWSTNRSIKNIAEIKLGLDSIQTLVNDQLYQNYQSTESIYPFFTRNRKLIPIQTILERRAIDDTLRQIRAKKDKIYNDSMRDSNLDKMVMLDTNFSNGIAEKLSSDSSLILTDSKTKSNQKPLVELTKLDTSFRKKKVNRVSSQIQEGKTKSDTIPLPIDQLENESQSSKLITSIDTTGTKKELELRSTPLSKREKFVIDSVVQAKKLMTNAITLALNNSRNLKNNFNVKMAQVDNFDREYRRYQIAWYQKYSQAFACFVMFMIGAPLGAIIKKGGLGMPVILSITFFILYYMLTITGEKWAKEGLVDVFIGTWFSNLSLIPFGIFFLRQAKKDARLFEPDFYLEFYKFLQDKWKVILSKRS